MSFTISEEAWFLCENGKIALDMAFSMPNANTLREFSSAIFFFLNVILTHQKPTLLFYHIILQYPIYYIFYPSILHIKIIY